MNEWTQFEIALRRESFHMLLIAMVAYAISFAITMWALSVVSGLFDAETVPDQ